MTALTSGLSMPIPNDDGEEEEEEEEENESGKKRKKRSKSDGTDILSMIARLNDEAEKKAEDVEFWFGVMQEFFAFLKQDSRFVAKVLDELNRYCHHIQR